jgi:hypothetical protein
MDVDSEWPIGAHVRTKIERQCETSPVRPHIVGDYEYTQELENDETVWHGWLHMSRAYSGEMGHGLHGMLSSVTYSRLAGTNVLRDFVELPSQLLEHWLRSTDVVLRSHAAHCETGEPIPSAMLKRLNDARNFNQVIACALPSMSASMIASVSLY